MCRTPIPILEQTRAQFLEIVRNENLLEAEVAVLGRPLTPEEAIGTPGRRDFPIIRGKERILEARCLGARGQAFTDAPREFTGTLSGVLELEWTSNQNRAIYIATLNAVLAHLGRACATVHCKDDDPERCGREIANRILERHGKTTVGLIGLNPAIADHLIDLFGAAQVHISDLYQGNVGKERLGVQVWDGAEQTQDIIEASEVVLLTGTTLQNGTFDEIWATIQDRGKTGLVFGVTAAGVCALAGLERVCPYGRNG